MPATDGERDGGACPHKLAWVRIGANILPTEDWATIRDIAVRADRCRLDAVSLLDHYHTDRTDRAWLSGWSVYGALAAVTSHVKLVPMVIDRLNYLPGVLAKEAAVLSVMSGGRFELGIGAGDHFVEQEAWGLDVPNVATRIAALEETVQVLHLVWTGEKVSFDGTHMRLRGAASLPAPVGRIRTIVGAGSSRRLVSSAVRYADEVNVYADDGLLEFARTEIDRVGRDVSLSVYVWDWPDDVEVRLRRWASSGIQRAFLTFWPPFDQIEDVAALAASL